MNSLTRSCVCGVGALVLAACNDDGQQVLVNDVTDQNATQEAQQQQQADLNAVELPPAITRSPAYRCQDGGALYVDVLDDSNAVLVRDSRTDTPVRLERAEGQGSFTGDGRTLSDTDSEVIYAAPDRPSQMCREAQE